MNDRAFAAWVQPVARTLAADRAELLAFARQAPPAFWARPGAVDGWTNADILAHTGGGNDQLLQLALRAAVTGKPLGPETWSVDTDAENARRVDERRTWPVDRIIDEIAALGDELQELLAELTEDDRDARTAAGKLTLEQFLEIVRRERHDHEHLAQLRAAMAATMTAGGPAP